MAIAIAIDPVVERLVRDVPVRTDLAPGSRPRRNQYWLRGGDGAGRLRSAKFQAAMVRGSRKVLPLLLGFALFAVAPDHARAGADAESCRDEASVAERAAGIPPGLLLAIGKRESGRADVRTGDVLPWPWTVDREGEGHMFGSQDEAIAYVAAAQRDGSPSIDVGCFQINLNYHPAAFASLKEAFDPASNAAYAARFLSMLHARAGNWETAVAQYHSATPWLGIPYQEAVFATWLGTAPAPTPITEASFRPVIVTMHIPVWTPSTIPSRSVVSRIDRRLPHVIVPGGTITQIRFGRLARNRSDTWTE